MDSSRCIALFLNIFQDHNTSSNMTRLKNNVVCFNTSKPVAHLAFCSPRRPPHLESWQYLLDQEILSNYEPLSFTFTAVEATSFNRSKGHLTG